MRRLVRLGMLACLMIGAAWHRGSAAEPMPRPDDGGVADGFYTNPYFDLSYPLPSGWTQTLAGPGPSSTGYYVLASLAPPGELTGTVLIAAQDAFFATAVPAGDAVTAAQAFADAIARVDGMRIDRPPARQTIAGRDFARVDFSGVGLFRSSLFTLSRCHLVSFNLTAKSPALLSELAASLERIGAADGAARNDPACVADAATTDNLLVKIDPPASGPAYTPIPVRLVVGTDGAVRHVHVIRASAAQRAGIEGALAQWKFKPRAIDGRVAAIETGVVIEFTPDGVRYAPRTGQGR